MLGESLKNACAAFPQLLKVGKAIVCMLPQRFYDVSERISAASNLDQRLAMQYALSTVVVEEVCVWAFQYRSVLTVAQSTPNRF